MSFYLYFWFDGYGCVLYNLLCMITSFCKLAYAYLLFGKSRESQAGADGLAVVCWSWKTPKRDRHFVTCFSGSYSGAV